MSRRGAARRLVENHDIAGPAARTAQPALKPRQRKRPAPRPQQRLHVRLPTVAALTARLRARALGAARSKSWIRKRGQVPCPSDTQEMNSQDPKSIWWAISTPQNF